MKIAVTPIEGYWIGFLACGISTIVLHLADNL
jgi:hypothetical protein